MDAEDAADLRLALEQDFATAAYLTAEIQSAATRDREVLTTSLDETTARLTDHLTVAYPDTRVDEFRASWLRYLRAAASRGEPEAEAVAQRARDLAEQMAELTDDGVAIPGTTRLLRTPARDLARSIASFEERNYDAAYTGRREAHAGMVAVARTFSAAVAEHQPDKFPGPRTSGPIELRSALRQLLSEHTLLTATVLRRGSRATKDFDAAAAALNGNTEDLTAAIDSVYPDVGDEFASRWRARISNLADYVAAAVDKPRERKAAQRAATDDDRDLARLLPQASDEHIDAVELPKQVSEHTDALIAVADTYIDRDVAASENALREALERSAAIADVIATGIVEQDPDAFEAP